MKNMVEVSLPYRIVAVSENTNSFGLRGVVVMAKDGEAYEIGMSDFALSGRVRGDVVMGKIHIDQQTRQRIDKPAFFPYAEIPRKLDRAPKQVIAEVWS